MSEFTQALGLIAPVYNLGLVTIVVILFLQLFRTYKRTSIGFIKPWVLIFVAVAIYIAEAVFTVVRSMGVFNLPYHVNGYFELAIITLFIYALLLQREHIKRRAMPSVFSKGLPTLEGPTAKKAKASKKPAKKKAVKKPAKKAAKKKPAKKKPVKRKGKKRR